MNDCSESLKMLAVKKGKRAKASQGGDVKKSTEDAQMYDKPIKKKASTLLSEKRATKVTEAKSSHHLELESKTKNATLEGPDDRESAMDDGPEGRGS